MANNPTFEQFLKEGGVKNKVAPERGAVGSIFVPQAQYDRYMDPKLGFDVSRDNEDYYGENQGVFEKIAYAVPSFVGNTAINIVGNLSAIPVGIVSAIANQDASKLIDNSYTQALDSMSEGISDTFKFYRTKEEEENSVLGNMFGTGAANFWLNDFLNGASFAIGAVASEAIMTGLSAATFGGTGVAQVGMTARLINRAGKLFKAADKAADAAGAFKYADDAVKMGQNATEAALKATAQAQGLTSLGTLGRQLTFGTAYEASVEARHHMRDLKEQLIERKKAAKGGAELDSFELEDIDDQVKSSGTGVFLSNMALLSVSNAAQFNHFTYGVKNLIGKNAGKQVIKGLEKKAFVEGADEAGKAILKPAFETWGKLRKTWDVVKLVKNPLTEGLEESLQSVINNGFTEYSMNKLNPYSQKESADLIESFGDAFSKQFDLGNKEGWKEFAVGFVLGGAGIPMYGRKGVDAEGKTKYGFTLMGGIADDIKDRKYEREQTKQYAKFYNATQSKSPIDSVNVVRNTVKAGIETNSISKQYDDHINEGNFKEAKDSQEDIAFSFIKAAFDTGRFDTRVKGIADDVLAMSNDEFAKQFGYDNLSEEELQSRKESVVKTYETLANQVKDSIKLVDSALPNVNESLRTAIAHSLFRDKRIDDRISSLVNRVNELGGFGYRPEKLNDIIGMFSKTYAFEPEEGQLVNKKALDDNIKFQTLAKEYEELTAPDPTLTVEESVARNKKAEKVKTQIEQLIKKYPAIAGAANIMDVTNNINEYNKFLDSLNTIKEAPGVNKDELDTISSDLNKLFADKIRYTALHNYLFTKEGQTKYDNIEQAMKELFEEAVNKTDEELNNDPTFQHKLRLVLEGMGLPTSLIEKGKKLNLGMLKDRDQLEKESAIDKAKTKEAKKKEKDKNKANQTKEEAKSNINNVKTQIENEELLMLISEIEQLIDSIDFNNINNSTDINNLKENKTELENFKLKLKEELAKGNKDASKIQSIITSIDNTVKDVNTFLSNFGKNKIIADIADKAYRHGFENLNRNFFVPEGASPEVAKFYEDLSKQLTAISQEEFENAIGSKSIEIRRVSPPNAGQQYELRNGFYYTVPQYFSLLYANGKMIGSLENPQQYMYSVEGSNDLIPIDWFSDVENPTDLFLSQIAVFNGNYVVGNKLSENAKIMVAQAKSIISFYENVVKDNETIPYDVINQYFNLSKSASRTDGISRTLEDVFFSGKINLPEINIDGNNIDGIVLIESIGGELKYNVVDAEGNKTTIPPTHELYKILQEDDVKEVLYAFLKFGSYVIFNPNNKKLYPAELGKAENWGEGSAQILNVLNSISTIDISEENYEELLKDIPQDSNGNYLIKVPGTGEVLVKLFKSKPGQQYISARINFSFSEQANTPDGKLFIPTRPTNDKQLFPFGNIDVVVEKSVNRETGKNSLKITVQFPDKLNPKKFGFIDFYLDEENCVIENNNIVGFKLDMDKEFTLYPYTLNNASKGVAKAKPVVCKSFADLFKHINDNREAYSSVRNLDGLQNCEINIKEEDQERSGFKLVDTNPVKLTVKENPDGAIKIVPKNTGIISKPASKKVEKTSTIKAKGKPESVKNAPEPVIEEPTSTTTTTPSANDNTIQPVSINGEIVDFTISEIKAFIDELSKSISDPKHEPNVQVLSNLAKHPFLNSFIKEYVQLYQAGVAKDIRNITSKMKKTDFYSEVIPQLLVKFEDIIKTSETTPTPTPSTSTDIITDEVYNSFIDKNIVPENILNSIADKVMKRETLSQRETAIFTGKTSEINEIIRNKATTATAPTSTDARADIERRREETKNSIKEGFNGGKTWEYTGQFNDQATKEKIYEVFQDEYTKEQLINEIDAKYNAELAALDNTSNIESKTKEQLFPIDSLHKGEQSGDTLKVIGYTKDGVRFEIQTEGTLKPKRNVSFSELKRLIKEGKLTALEGGITVETETPKKSVQSSKTNLINRKKSATKNNENPDNQPPFSMFNENELEESSISYEQAVRNIAELLPDTIDIRDINEVIGKLSANGVPAGVLFNRIIYLSKNFRNKGTEYHEAFHAVFRLLFNDQEIANVLQLASVKYGIPTIDQLLDLRDRSAEYNDFTQEQLTQLWYEEKLADDFAKYATSNGTKKDLPNGFFAKLWALIKSFIGITKSTDDSVEKYFDNILNKSYKNRQVRTTAFPTLINISVFDLYKNSDGLNITSAQSQRITAQTLKEVLVAAQRNGVDLNDIQDELIIDAFKDVINSKYDPDLYWDYLMDMPDYKREAIEDRIGVFYETLYRVNDEGDGWVEHDKNFPTIVNEIRKKLKYYEEIVNETWDVSENEEETPDQLSSIESYKVGGFSSAPAFMRYFMSTVELKEDVFGIGVDVESLSDSEQDFFTTTADGYKIYNGVLSRVSDLRKDQILPALMSMVNNKNIEAFRQKLLTEVLKEYYFNTGNRRMAFEASYMNYDPEVHTHEELSKTALYNMFLRTFDKARINPTTTYVDQKSGSKKDGTSISIGRANLRGVDQKQLEQWDINWSVKKRNFKDKSEILSVLNNIKAQFESNPMTFETLNEVVTNIKSSFSELGVELHEDYIKASLLSVNRKLLNQKVKEDDVFSKEALLFLSTVPGSLKRIDSKMLTGMIASANSLSTNLNLFANISTVTNDDDVLVDTITQANTRYRQMAEGNAFFDENVVEANYRNADGETVYSFVEKSYITTFVKQAKDIFSEVFDEIETNPDFTEEDASDMLLEKMIDAEFFTQDDYYLAKSRVRLLMHNFLLKNKKERDIFLSNLDIKFIDGLVDRPLKKEKGEINTDISKGKGFDRRASTYGSMSVRDKLLYNIFNYVNSASIVDEETVGTKKQTKIEIFSQSIGVQSDKNTHFLIDFIKKNYVTINDFTTGFYESVNDLIRGEYNRIVELQKESKDLFEYRTTGKKAPWIQKSNLEIGYEDFHYIRKNGVDYYIVDGQVKGIDRDGNVVESQDVTLDNFRGLQLYNFNPARYALTNPDIAEQLEALRNGAINNLPFPGLDVSKGGIKMIMDFQFERFKKMLFSTKINALSEVKTDGGETLIIQRQQILPSQLFSKTSVKIGGIKQPVSVLNENMLKNYFFNYYLNNMAFSQMLRGDKYLSVSDPTNGVKRESKNNASGPNMGVGQTNVSIIDPTKELLDDLERTGVKIDPNRSIERADAQGIARMDWHQTYLRALGKQDIRIKQIYRKYEKTGVLSEQDSNYLESKGALMQTLKLVYSADKYLKMSVTFLNRRDTSTVLPQNEVLFKTLIDAKHAAEDNNNFLPTNFFDDTTLESLGLTPNATVESISEKLRELYVPLVGREQLHDLLNSMESTNTDFTVYKSGSKTVNKDVGYYHNGQWVLKPSAFTNSNLREQVVTENLKDSGIDGTQKNQLITSEQFGDAETTFNDKRIKVSNAVSAHDKHLANRIKLQYEQLKSMVVNKNGKAVWDYILDEFINDLNSSGKNPLVLEYAKAIKNEQGFTNSPEYNLNHPFVEGLFQQSFLSFASKNSTKSKANLIKFTLVSDDMISMVRDTSYYVDKEVVALGDSILNNKLNKNGTVSNLTEQEQEFVDNNLELEKYNNNYELAYANWRSENVNETVLSKRDLVRLTQGRYTPNGEITTSRLKHRVLGEDGKYYSECIVSEWFLKKYGLKVGDRIPDRLLKMLGVRIPTQDKHSMVSLRIAGFKPGIHGNDIHVPMEVLYLSGADFDIDALYTRIIAKLANKNKFFGDYIKSSNYNDALETAFEEFVDDVKSNKIYKKNLRIALQNSEIIRDYNKLLNVLNNAFEEINKRSIEEKNQNFAESLNVGSLIELNDQQYRIEDITPDNITLLDLDTNVSTTFPIDQFNSQFAENTESQFEKVTRESKELFDQLPEEIKVKYRERRNLLREFGNSVFNNFISDIELTTRLLETELYGEDPLLQAFGESLQNILNEFGIPSSNLITSLFNTHNDHLHTVILPKAFSAASGINPDISEFEGKYGRTIRNNMQAYTEGRVDDITPITISETNNILLELEMGLVHNSGNKEISGTPATISPLREIEKELASSGVLTDSEHYGEDSPLDHFSFNESIEQGKKGIGIVAVSNILAQLLYKNNISIRRTEKGYVINPIFNTKTGFSDNQTALEEILNDGGIRKNDIKSTVLSAMTDNAKEVLAGVFNLNGDTLGVFDTLLDMGVTLRKSAFFTRQPILVALSAINSNNNSVILSSTDITKKKNKQKGKFSNDEDVLLAETLLDATPKNELSEFEGATSDEILTEENLKNAILFETHMNNVDDLIKYNVSFTIKGTVYGVDPNNLEESIEEMKEFYNRIQMSTYNEYNKAKKINNYLFNMTKILSLSKGFPSSFGDIDIIKKSLNDLGIKVSEGNPLNLNSYELSYVDGYDYNVSDFPLTNILELIQNSNLITTNIQAMYAVSDVSKEFFIMNTDAARKVYSSVIKSVGSVYGAYAREELSKIYPTVLSALVLAAYRKQISDGTITTKLKMQSNTGNPHLNSVFDLSPLFDIKGNRELLNRARRSNEADVNLLLKTMGYTTTSYKGVQGSALENREVGRFIGDSISKRNPEYAMELVDAYTRLINNPETRDLAFAIFNQILLRDGMMFTRDSLIRHINPSFMKSLHNTMNDMHEGLLELEGVTNQEDRNEMFIYLFGMEEIALTDMIQKLILQSTQFQNILTRLDAKALASVQRSHFKSLDAILEESKKDKETEEESSEKKDMVSLLREFAENLKSEKGNAKESTSSALYPYSQKDAGKVRLSDTEVSKYTSNDSPIRMLENENKDKYMVLDIFAGLNLPEAKDSKGAIVNQNLKTIKNSGLAKIGYEVVEETGAIHRHLILSPIIKSDGKIYKLIKFVSATKVNGKNNSIIWNPVSSYDQLPDGIKRFAEKKIFDAETALDYKQEFIFTEEEIEELKKDFSTDKLIEQFNKKFYDHVNPNMLPKGVKAVYVETDSIGTKEISTIAGTVEQWLDLKKNKPSYEIPAAPEFESAPGDNFYGENKIVKQREDEQREDEMSNDSKDPFSC
jgi:hypothetical protein